ncbi:MAG: hypothetical protein K2I80_11420 [Ruminococcus sp.]|nr:hypothetical protein [Ruminococcus sp.]MDE6848668.1 hypothetical protein [Ruminococcus sp.]
MTENYKYYDGFEGESEYIFCLYSGDCLTEKIHIWDGYFSDIINTIEPTENGWTSLAEYYQLCIEFDNDNWKVPDSQSALQQLKNVDNLKIRFPKSHEVLKILIDVFIIACENNLTVYIEYC